MTILFVLVVWLVGSVPLALLAGRALASGEDIAAGVGSTYSSNRSTAA